MGVGVGEEVLLVRATGPAGQRLSVTAPHGAVFTWVRTRGHATF